MSKSCSKGGSLCNSASRGLGIAILSLSALCTRGDGPGVIAPELLAGTWEFRMLTGEQAVVELRPDGTCSLSRVQSGKLVPSPPSTGFDFWKSDGVTVAFYSRKAGSGGLGKESFGVQEIEPDVWTIRRGSKNELVLHKPPSEGELVLKRRVRPAP